MLEGDFTKRVHQEFRTAERVAQIRHEDNLKIEGAFSTPEKPEFIAAERVSPKKPTDNLKIEDVKFTTPERPQYQKADRPVAKKPTDNLKVDAGEFKRPEKPHFVAADRQTLKKPTDNLKLEGDFTKRDRQEFRTVERVTQIRHEDNLKIEGSFTTPEKPQYRKADRVVPKKPTDNLKMEGTMAVVKKSDYGQNVESTKVVSVKGQHKSTVKSSILLGEDTSIMRTTNQINYNKSAQRSDQIIVDKAPVKDDQIKRDGAIMITTKKVTTVLAGDNRNKGDRIHKIVPNISFDNTENMIVNRQSKINVVSNIKESQVIKEGSISSITSEKIINGTTIPNGHSKTSSQVMSSDDRHMLSTIGTMRDMTSKITSDSKHISSTSGTVKDVTSQISSADNRQVSSTSGTLKESSSSTSNYQIQKSSSMTSKHHVQEHNIGTVITSQSAIDHRQSSEMINSHQHHRKNVISESSEQMSNAILTRKSADRQNESNISKGFSITGAQQRKSISNLHEQSQSSSNTGVNDRKSLSYMHRTGGRDGVDFHHSTECQLHPQQQRSTDTSSSSSHQIIGRDSGYGQDLRNYDQRIGQSRTSNSSINFGQKSKSYETEESKHQQKSISTMSATTHISTETGRSGSDLQNISSGSREGGSNMQTISSGSRGHSNMQTISSGGVGNLSNIKTHSSEYRTISSGSPSQYTTRVVSTPIAGSSSAQLHQSQNRAVRRHQATSSNIVFGGYDNDNSSAQTRFSSTSRSEYVKDSFKPCPASHIDKNHMKQTRTTKSHQFFQRDE